MTVVAAGVTRERDVHGRSACRRRRRRGNRYRFGCRWRFSGGGGRGLWSRLRFASAAFVGSTSARRVRPDRVRRADPAGRRRTARPAANGAGRASLRRRSGGSGRGGPRGDRVPRMPGGGIYRDHLRLPNRTQGFARQRRRREQRAPRLGEDRDERQQRRRGQAEEDEGGRAHPVKEAPAKAGTPKRGGKLLWKSSMHHFVNRLSGTNP